MNKLAPRREEGRDLVKLRELRAELADLRLRGGGGWSRGSRASEKKTRAREEGRRSQPRRGRRAVSRARRSVLPGGDASVE